MTWSSIDLVESLIRIKTGKTGAELTLPLHENLAAWLREHKQGLGKAKVFPELAGKGTGGRYGLSGRFKTIMEGAGISGRVTRTADGKGRTISSLSFHSLRHSFVSALANAGVTQDLRQKLSGHADDQTHYTHHDIANLRTAVAKLPNVVMA
jgi:integrase